jgi:nitrate/nitrite transporter NarK
VWILACIVFVFITVLEYAYILFMMRRVKQNEMSKDNKAKAKKQGGKYSTNIFLFFYSFNSTLRKMADWLIPNS